MIKGETNTKLIENRIQFEVSFRIVLNFLYYIFTRVREKQDVKEHHDGPCRLISDMYNKI